MKGAKVVAKFLARTHGLDEKEAEETADNVIQLAEYHQTRMERAQGALDLQDEPDEDYSVTDLLADLMHYCDEKGWDFASLAESAKGHYECEKEGGVF